MLDTGLEEGVEVYASFPFEAMHRMASDLLDETAVIPEQITMQHSYQAQEVQQPSALESTLSAQLEEILTAIKAGQVLMLDGNQLVGGTADRMNQALGQIQAISIRR
jgi:hypothetical protein